MKHSLILFCIFALLEAGCAGGGGGSNACGGSASLDFAPGEMCGDCGYWECDGSDAVACNDPGANGCGGCEVLTNEPGSACGECKTYVCQGGDATECQDTGPNDCGGCTVLPHTLGDVCGDCGAWICDGEDTVMCDEADPNACGGCLPLAHDLGEPCGTCGAYTCVAGDPNAVECIEEPNECGGCAVLPQSVGDGCGDCGELVCDGYDALMCDDPGTNECGGCSALPGSVGGSCACGEGTFVCNGGDALSCNGADDDTFATPNFLGNFEDGDDNIYNIMGTLDPVSDTEDWFSSFSNDTIWGDMDVRAWLDNIPPNHNYDLCVYYDPGRDADVTCVEGLPSTFNGLHGCCSTHTGSMSESVELSVDAIGTTDEDGTFYYRVWYQSGAGDCTQYSLSYAF